MTDEKRIIDALDRMSHSIRTFTSAVNQQFKLAPVIQLVLPTLRDYHATREILLHARSSLAPHMLAEMTNQKHGPEIECFTYGGVEIQLICHEQVVTRTGQKLGATEVGYVYLRGFPPLSNDDS